MLEVSLLNRCFAGYKLRKLVPDVEPTPWSRVLLEKFILAQLLKKFKDI
jgi:hypothetical protein